MAEYGLIVELSRQTVETLIRAGIRFDGKHLNPPVELEIPLAAPGNGLLRVIAADVRVDLATGRGVRVRLPFSGGSVMLESPFLALSLLEGHVTIAAELQLRGKGLGLDLGAATADILFTPDSRARIEAAVAETGRSPEMFERSLRVQLVDYVHGQGRQVISLLGLAMDFGAIGFASSGRLNPLEIQNLENTSVALVGALRPHKRARPRRPKWESSLRAGDDVAVAIGADLLRFLLGRPAAIEAYGLKLTGVRHAFAEGSIDIEGAVRSSGSCHQARGSFRCRVTFSDGGSQIAVDPPSLNVDVPCYCYEVAQLFGLPPLLIGEAVQSRVDRVVEELRSAATAFTGGSLGQAVVSRSGISLSGAFQALAPRLRSPAVSISGSVTTTESKAVFSGTYHVPAGCLKGDYPYTEVLQSQAGLFVAAPTLLAQPVTFEWGVAWDLGPGGLVPFGVALLTGAGGMATLDRMECHYPLPLAHGSVVRQPVHVGYAILADTVKLNNDPDEGTYSFTLFVRATDAAGQVEVASTRVTFFGHAVHMGGDYHDRLWSCVWSSVLQASPLPLVRKIPPAPRQVPGLIRRLMAARTTAADDLIGHAKLGLDTAFFDALFPRDPVSPADVLARAPAVSPIPREASSRVDVPARKS
jgi:hypothetical protein